MDKLENQITEHAAKIESIRAVMKKHNDKIHELGAKKPSSPGPERNEIERQQQVQMTKWNMQHQRLPELQLELGRMEEAQLAVEVGEVEPQIQLHGDTSLQVFLDETSELSRNISADPNKNPYWYSRRELEPKHAAVAQKRTSMRARGKNPGEFKSNLRSYDDISQEQEGIEDSDLIRHEQDRQARAAAHPVVRRGAKRMKRHKGKHTQKKKRTKTKRSVPKSRTSGSTKFRR